jgi:LDH2 family malate/lactate/ureidoglycolate dehydrogenase
MNAIRIKEGIPLNAKVVEDLKELAKKFDLKF